MASEDNDRRELFDLLEPSIGTRGAALLMTNLPPVGWAELATKADLAALRAELLGDAAGVRGEMGELRGELTGQMGELRGELTGQMGELRGQLTGQMGELRGELTGQMAELRGGMAEVRGEMAILRSDMNNQLPKLVTANIASMIATFGLALAASAMF